MLKECMYDVTDKQIGQAYKCFEGKNPFYMVVNSKNETDADGHLVEYKVRARYDVESKQWVFSCTCMSGLWNFKNIKHESKVCWHVRAALTCAREEKQALKAMSAQIDAEKQSAEVTTSESVVPVVVADPVTSSVTPVTVTPTERAIVATEVARDLRAKTASRMSGWNNSHMSTLTEREKWVLTAKPSHHMRKSEPVVKGALYSKPFNLYR